jgi:para-nitrobenzyl esterase
MSRTPRIRHRSLPLLFGALTLFGCAEEAASVKVGDASAATAGDAGRPAPAKDASAASATDGSSKPSAAPSVSIDDGALNGTLVGTTRQFLGIPYAKPPLGELRWQPPQPNDKWPKARAATTFGKRCAQPNSAVLMNAPSEDEDCLYLNVWAPEASEPLPVMVWIHGGGNTNGSASEPVPYVGSGFFYEGRSLAEKGVVVVTFNYRLGVFGFLDHAALEGAGGNQGLHDQQAALEWVKKNIAAFGGDPENVTIFGESAGSYDVCAHVASPKSRGLFHKAISQSGGCTTLLASKETAQKQGASLAAKLGCGGDDAEALTCLREKGVAELLAAATPDVGAFGPSLDGEFLPDQPRSLFDRGEIAKVPYILGSNTDEGTLFVAASQVADEAAYEAALTSQFGAERVEAIATLYPPSKFEGANPFKAALARVVGDARLVCTTYDSALRAVAAGSTVYAYNYDIPTPIGDLGATHGAELTSVFGTSPSFTPASKAASEQIQRYWTNFAKTGNPNGGSDLEWPELTADANVRINLALEPSLVTDFRAEECAFWRAGYDKQFAAP